MSSSHPLSAAGNPSDNNKPSLRARAARFFSREGPGGITLGAWAAVAAAAVAVAVATWRDSERAREAEREVLTSSSDDWRQAKREAKEAARDARSAASKWSKGQ